MFVGSIPSTHNKTFSSFSICLRCFLSSPQNKSLQHDLLGAGHKEKAGLGLQASRGCGWRGVELSTQVPGSSRMGHAPPQPGGPSQLGCPEITPETKWLKQQTFVSHSSGGWEIQSQSEGRFGS